MPQLTEEYRPDTYDDLISQSVAVERVKRILSRPKFDRGALLLKGPSGCGKTTLAHIVARQLAICDFSGIVRIESRECTLGTLRDTESNMWTMPAKGEWKVYIIDEAHEMLPDAQRYALGLLERLPRNRLIIGTTTETEPFKGPLASRWISIRLQPPEPEEIAALLQQIADHESITIPASPTLLQMIKQRRSNVRECINDILEAGELF